MAGPVQHTLDAVGAVGALMRAGGVQAIEEGERRLMDGMPPLSVLMAALPPHTRRQRWLRGEASGPGQSRDVKRSTGPPSAATAGLERVGKTLLGAQELVAGCLA